MNGPAPPTTLTVAVPLEPVLQLTLVLAVTVATGLALSLTVIPFVEIQPFPSVTVTLYTPESKVVAVAFVPPEGDHRYK